MKASLTENSPAKPGHIFLQTADTSYSYGELYKFQNGLLQHLKSNALERKPDRIMLISELSKFSVFIVAACWNLGIPVIPLSPQQYSKYSPRRLSTMKPSHRFISPELSMQDNVESPLTETLFEKFINHPPPSPFMRKRTCDAEQHFGIFHSSGTTGKPKEIPLKRRQLLYATKSSAHYLQPEPGKLWLLCLPHYHIGGSAVILRSLLFGCGIYLMPSFEQREAAKLISTHPHIAAASLVPTMLNRLLNESSFNPHPSFNKILLGGGPMPSTLIEKAARKGVPLIKSYGMTETCAQITALPVPTTEKPEDISGSVGPVFSPNEIQIRTSEQKILPAFESGLIWLRGPQVFDGYGSTKRAENPFDGEGWFNTGDYGYMDENEQLYIEMRRTDRIVSGGKNINPYKIENLLLQWDRIREVAIVGVPDEEWGEIVTAFVVPNPEKPEITVSLIKEYLREKVAGYEVPKKVYVRDDLPKTPVGKIKRGQLKTEGSP